MRLAHATNIVQSNATLESSQATIQADAHMFKVLSSGLYTNKIRALLREIGANAADAHLMIGKQDQPIEVHLPTKLNPLFWIRDFGPGMTHDFVMHNYMCYGKSTKRDTTPPPGLTDAERAAWELYVSTATGALGLGCKCPYAYTDQFSVEVAQNGTLRRYACYVRADGMFQTDLVQETTAPADWPHGVRVTVPVKEDDIHTFTTEAEFVYYWFRTPPKLINGALPTPLEGMRFGPYLAVRDDDPHINSLYLHMGDCAYQVDAQTLTNTGFVNAVTNDVFQNLDSKEKVDPDNFYFLIQRLIAQGGVLEMPMGSFDFAASREAPEYTPRTLRALRTTLCDVTLHLIRTTQHLLLTTPWHELPALANRISNTWLDSWAMHYLLPATRTHRSWDLMNLVRNKYARLPDWARDDCHGLPENATLYTYGYESHNNVDTLVRRKASTRPSFVSIHPQSLPAAIVIGTSKHADQRIRTAMTSGQYRTIAHYYVPAVTTEGVDLETRKQIFAQHRAAADRFCHRLAQHFNGVPVVHIDTLPTVVNAPRTRGPATPRPKLSVPRAKGYLITVDHTTNSANEAYLHDHLHVKQLAFSCGTPRKRWSNLRLNFCLIPKGNWNWYTFPNITGCINEVLAKLQDTTTRFEFFVLRDSIIDNKKLLTDYGYTTLQDPLFNWLDPLLTQASTIPSVSSSFTRYLKELDPLTRSPPTHKEALLAHIHANSTWWQDIKKHLQPSSPLLSMAEQAQPLIARALQADTDAAADPHQVLGDLYPSLHSIAQCFFCNHPHMKQWDKRNATASTSEQLRYEIDSLLAPYNKKQSYLQSLKNMGLLDTVASPALAAQLLDRLYP